MIFNSTQIADILRILERNTIMFSTTILGVDVLSDYDKEILKLYGIDIDSLKQDITSYEAMYHFGVLSQMLKEQEAKKLKYATFKRYIERGDYIKPSKREKEMIDIAKHRTYSHIKGLGEKQKQTVEGIILEEDQKSRERYEKVIGDAIKTGIEDRKSVQNIMLEIGNKTGDWQRDLGRLVATEYQSIYNLGRTNEIRKRGGENAKIYKDTFSGACKWCIKLHLTAGIGSEPIVKPLKEIEANGSNIGRKVNDWKFTIPPEHPFCRCEIRSFFEGQEWDEEMQMFMYPKKKD